MQGQIGLAQISNPAAWQGSATLTAPSLEIQGVTLRRASAALAVRDGRARLTDVSGDLNGGALTGSATIDLDGRRGLTTSFRLRGLDLAGVKQAPAALRLGGALDIDGTVEGTLTPPDLKGRGTMDAARFRLAGVPQSPGIGN